MLTLSKEQYAGLQKSLEKLGIKTLVTPYRRNNFKGGREPFAAKVEVRSFSFMVELASKEEQAAEAKRHEKAERKLASKEEQAAEDSPEPASESN
jgi:hypothetical protein